MLQPAKSTKTVLAVFPWFSVDLAWILGTRGRCISNPDYILTIASLVFALASGFPNEVSADELKEAKVTQVIQDVRVLPSNASPRPAAVNDDVRHGTAVQTGVAVPE